MPLKFILAVLIFFPSLSFSQPPFVLLDDYSFLQREGKVFQLKQSNDTLYEVQKSIFNENFIAARKHFKIHGFIEISNYHFLKLERLDTIPLTSDPYPLTRYLITAIKSMTDKQLGYLPIIGRLTKNQMDSISIISDSLNQKFFYTYYSSEYIKRFSTLKEITQKKDANKIIRLMKSKRYEAIINSWKLTKAGDFYGTGLIAELLNKACLETGYNPIGADLKISALKKKL